MSDDNDSGGIFGAIISTFILIALWPYILALLGIYIAYMIAVAILGWIAEHWLLTMGFIVGILVIYSIFKCGLISKAWRYIFAATQSKPIEVTMGDFPDLSQRKFIPSTNLYCYLCIRKLGIKAWCRSGKYYCDACINKIN